MSMPSFDERAATWDDDPLKRARAESVALTIRAAVPLDRSMRMLEYGAGTGLVTQALRGSVGPVTLADTSGGMREVMLAKIAAGTIPDAQVWDLDLATEAAPEAQFDLVVTVMALHHVVQLERALAGFAGVLVDGGRLCIVDLEEEDGSFHGHGFEGHQGFHLESLGDSLRSAGFVDVEFRPCGEVDRNGTVFPLFLATCVRRSAGRA